METIHIKTESRVEFKPVTAEIRKIVKSSGVKSGLCHVFVPHTTAAITLNEQADPAVAEDIVGRLDSLVPQRAQYLHMEGNAPAHIKASLIGNTVTLIIEDGDILLGTWQGVFFCEFDGPRQRRIVVKVIED